MTQLIERPTADPVAAAHARIISYYTAADATPNYGIYAEGDTFRVGHPGAWIVTDAEHIGDAILTLAALDDRARGLAVTM